jgi:hypothetical protein
MPRSYDQKELQRGYKQGPVGARRDSGMEQVRGRSESLTERRGHEVGKIVRSRVDGLMTPARGRENQRSVG